MENLDFLKGPREMRDLSLLQELEKNPIISQRELSEKFGFALGVTNACLKRMVRKGWIQMINMNHHKTGYFLTPTGLGEKSRLTHHLVSWTIQHYLTLKEIIGRRLLEMQQAGIERIVFYGVGEEMEIAYLTIQGVRLRLVGIVEDAERMKQKEVLGFELLDICHVEALHPDGILITSIASQEERMERVKEYTDPQRILVFSL